ncbi:MAG: deoxyribodipyrimidine photo-lyase [Candidatus Dormibacteria bacterium]
MTSAEAASGGLGIHWFRRNLRLDDNAALTAAGGGSRRLLCVFVVDEEQLRDEGIGPGRARYQHDALAELDATLRDHGGALLVRQGDPARVLDELVAETGAVVVTAVADVTPFSRRREREVSAALRRRGIELQLSSELFYTSPIATTHDDGRPYTVFSPYRRRFLAELQQVGTGDAMPPPLANLLPLATIPAGRPLPTVESLGLHDLGQQLIPGGERAARQRLTNFVAASDGLARYDQLRNIPQHQTSRLSADLHFGTVGIRTVLREALALRAGTSSTVVRRAVDAWVSELCWRDFYAAVLYHFPYVRTLEFREDMRDLPWDDDESRFAAWCAGRTGYPIVDAAMRQLNTTGWMHNRCRMIVASFLTKDLHLDWRLGERYFLERLVDADVANNNGGWQWAASTGTDPQPYFRIFNPVLQGKRFDPDGAYVRAHLPELGRLPAEVVHTPWLARDASGSPGDYPRPIVDHATERQVALAAYRARSGRPPVRSPH